MSGYQLPIGIEIFRGRYVDSFAQPARAEAGQGRAIPLGPAQRGSRLPAGSQDHGADPVEPVPALRPQPADVRPNIFYAKPGDYRAATQQVYRGGATASAVLLPIVP